MFGSAREAVYWKILQEQNMPVLVFEEEGLD